MKVTTRAVFDIATGERLHWEGYEYAGPVALCGAVFSKLSSNLTNPGILSPNGSMQYSTPAGIGPALAAASAATVQPNTSTVDGTLGPDGTSTVTANNNAPAPVSQPPRIIAPTWQQAQNSDNPAELTTKGKALSLLLSGMEGAARGAAAGAVTNPHISDRQR